MTTWRHSFDLSACCMTLSRLINPMTTWRHSFDLSACCMTLSRLIKPMTTWRHSFDLSACCMKLLRLINPITTRRHSFDLIRLVRFFSKHITIKAYGKNKFKKQVLGNKNRCHTSKQLKVSDECTTINQVVSDRCCANLYYK